MKVIINMDPCHQCGYESPMIVTESGGNRTEKAVRCKACHSTTIYFYPTEEQAIIAWNGNGATRGHTKARNRFPIVGKKG